MLKSTNFVAESGGMGGSDDQVAQTSTHTAPTNKSNPDCLVTGVLKANADVYERQHAYKLREFPRGFGPSFLNNSSGCQRDKTCSTVDTPSQAIHSSEHSISHALPGIQSAADPSSLRNNSGKPAATNSQSLIAFKEKYGLPRSWLDLSSNHPHDGLTAGKKAGDYDKSKEANPPENTLTLNEARSLRPSVFPEQHEEPTGIAVRLPPHTPQLRALDDIYNQQEHPTLGTTVDEAVQEMARMIVQQAIKDRMPYVKLASSRLQAMMGLRNDYQFKLPLTPPATPPKVPSGKGGGKGPNELNNLCNSERLGEIKSEGTVANTRAHGPVNLTCSVNQETGRGLRDYLMNMGGVFGIRKVQCTQLSFHDTRENMEARLPQNQTTEGIVYAERDGFKIEAYEIDLVKAGWVPETGAGTQTWIAFMITAPSIILDYNVNCLPEGFPKNIPESWVVFALPLSNCSQHGVMTEMYPTDPTHTPISSPPVCTSTTLSGFENKVHKRNDFDLSFSGVPIFEFSEKPKGFIKGWDSWCMDNGELNLEVDINEQNWAAGSAGQFLSVPSFLHGQPIINERSEDAWYDYYFSCVRTDVNNWKATREIMSQGKIRIVARWDEPVEANPASLVSSEKSNRMWEEELSLFVNDNPRAGDGLGLLPSNTPGMAARVCSLSSEKKGKKPLGAPASKQLKLKACLRSRVSKPIAGKVSKGNVEAKRVAAVNAWANRR